MASSKITPASELRKRRRQELVNYQRSVIVTELEASHSGMAVLQHGTTHGIEPVLKAELEEAGYQITTKPISWKWTFWKWLRGTLDLEDYVSFSDIRPAADMRKYRILSRIHEQRCEIYKQLSKDGRAYVDHEYVCGVFPQLKAELEKAGYVVTTEASGYMWFAVWVLGYPKLVDKVSIPAVGDD